MSESSLNSNTLLLKGIKSKNYELIHKALELGGASHDKSKDSNTLFFKSWNEIISLDDLSIIKHIYQSYPFKKGYHASNLLTSIILKKKECFDFFLEHCLNNQVNLNDKFGILLSNACQINPFFTYEENFEKNYISDYFISQLLKQNIDLNATTKHPLILLAENNNFHSWKLLFNHIKKNDDYSFTKYEKAISHSLYQFINQNSFMSEEVQYFFDNFDKKIMFSYGLKKISHPSYKGNDLSLFCLEMFAQEPKLFISKSKSLGKNNSNFLSTIQKINLFDKLDEKFIIKNVKSKGIKI